MRVLPAAVHADTIGADAPGGADDFASLAEACPHELRGKSMTVPLSPRPVAGAPVSMPRAEHRR